MDTHTFTSPGSALELGGNTYTGTTASRHPAQHLNMGMATLDTGIHTLTSPGSALELGGNTYTGTRFST